MTIAQSVTPSCWWRVHETVYVPSRLTVGHTHTKGMGHICQNVDTGNGPKSSVYFWKGFSGRFDGVSAFITVAAAVALFRFKLSPNMGNQSKL